MMRLDGFGIMADKEILLKLVHVQIRRRKSTCQDQETKRI